MMVMFPWQTTGVVPVLGVIMLGATFLLSLSLRQFTLRMQQVKGTTDDVLKNYPWMIGVLLGFIGHPIAHAFFNPVGVIR